MNKVKNKNLRKTITIVGLIIILLASAIMASLLNGQGLSAIRVAV